MIGDCKYDDSLEYKHSRKVRWETTFWHPVEIESLKLSRPLFNKFHGLSSQTIKPLTENEWNEVSQKLNEVNTPFRNLGIWGGLIQSPEYESEVIVLFGQMLQHLHMRILKIGTRFPDAIVEWKRDGEHWEKHNVEFELRSKGFQSHLRDPNCNDCVIVCWADDDWHDKHKARKKEFKIIELKKELEKIL